MTPNNILPQEPALTICVAQLGARMHYAVPRILCAAGMLERFYTDFVAVGPWPAVLKALGTASGARGVLGRMSARVPEGIPPGKITHWPAFGIEYYLRQRRAATPAQLTAIFLWAGAEFCRRVIRHGLGKASAVYTYNSAGLELLEHARERGVRRVMEQTIAPALVEDRLLAEEHGAWPGWVRPHQPDPARARLAARERAEWECAELIVCGSEFVRQGIVECGGPAPRCVVVPYGVDARLVAEPGHRGQQGRLRVLLAGEVGLRKGAPYVLQAARATKGWAEFRWCGPVRVLPEAATQLREHVELRGAVPRPQMREHYAWADVFLLPSICEGSAVVCYEALAAGVPVLTTENAGSIVREGIEGFIVPIRDARAIAERLEMLHRDRELLESMSRAALERACEFTVERYGQRLLVALRGLPSASMTGGLAIGANLTATGVPKGPNHISRR
jgi:glycosyltransferase involved in cell wall biosynthesis